MQEDELPCPQCQATVTPGLIAVALDFNGEKEDIIVIEGYHCDNCGSDFLSEEQQDLINEEFELEGFRIETIVELET